MVLSFVGVFTCACLAVHFASDRVGLGIAFVVMGFISAFVFMYATHLYVFAHVSYGSASVQIVQEVRI
jgi:hypothetical protein